MNRLIKRLSGMDARTKRSIQYMSKKNSKKRDDNSTEPQSANPQIPKDLSDQWGAVQACATAFNVLDKAYLPQSYMESARASLQFLAKLHEQSVEQCLKHPQAGMLSELKTLKAAIDKRQRKQEKKEGQNGKKVENFTAGEAEQYG